MHLTDCFMPLLGYVVAFRNAGATRQPTFEQVKADIDGLLSQAERVSRKGGLDAGDFDQARFAVCAFVDEALLASSWSDRHLWQREQLQRIYYNTTDAGVEVFDRLNNLGYDQLEAREVYYLCLSLGFKGRFIQPGDEFLLEQLKSSNLKIIAGGSGPVPSLETMELFPEAIAAQGAALSSSARFRFTPLTMMAIAAPVVLFGLLYLIYHFALSGVADKLS